MAQIHIVVAQMQGYWPEGWETTRKLEANREEFRKRLEEAVRRRPNLIVGSEMLNESGLTLEERKSMPGEDLRAGWYFQTASQIAKGAGCHVCYGIYGEDHGVKRNAGVLIGPDGVLIGIYFKVHLTTHEQDRGMIPGDSFPVFRTAIGDLGILICHDLSFPEASRCLMVGGARTILWPTLWSGWGEQLSYAVIASRAIDNCCNLVLASVGHDPERVNPNGGVKGRSAIFDPSGHMLCQKTDRLPGVLSGSVDSAPVRIAPWFTCGEKDDFLESVRRERRPSTYGALSEPARKHVDGSATRDRGRI